MNNRYGGESIDYFASMFQTLTEQRAILDAAEILGQCAARLGSQQLEPLQQLLRAKRYLLSVSSELSNALSKQLPRNGSLETQ